MVHFIPFFGDFHFEQVLGISLLMYVFYFDYICYFMSQVVNIKIKYIT
jgi:hypothetical protein